MTAGWGWLAGRMTEYSASSDHVFKDGDVLVVYASTHGHTARIVTRLSDTSHDYDYTDWDGVDRLGRELAENLKSAAGAPA